MIAPLTLTLLLLAPQEPRPTAEEGAPRAAQRERTAPADKPAEKAAEKAGEKAGDKAADKEKEEAPVVTKHEVRLAGGRVLRYSVTTGFMPLKSDAGDV